MTFIPSRWRHIFPVTLSGSGIRCCLVLCSLLTLIACGCGNPNAQKAQAARKKPALKDELPQIPGAVTGTGWRIRWRVRDPKRPQGPSLPIVDADARFGEMANAKDNDLVLLREVKATLYQNGKPAAIIEAPQVSARQREKILIGTGGVTLTSLADPPDTVVTADKITWDTATTKVIATGNAFITRKPRQGEEAFTQSGNKITFDTTLKEFLIE